MTLTYKMARELARRNSVGEKTHLWVVLENRVRNQTYYTVESVKLAGNGQQTPIPANAVASYRDGENWD